MAKEIVKTPWGFWIVKSGKKDNKEKQKQIEGAKNANMDRRELSEKH